MRSIALPGVTVDLWGSDLTVSRFADGGEVCASPHDTDDYRTMAELLGYGADTAQAAREHDIAHHLLAHWLGLPFSPGLRAVVDGEPDWTVCGPEEDAAMALQRYANAAGVDLVQVAERVAHALGR